MTDPTTEVSERALEAWVQARRWAAPAIRWVEGIKNSPRRGAPWVPAAKVMKPHLTPARRSSKSGFQPRIPGATLTTHKAGAI